MVLLSASQAMTYEHPTHAVGRTPIVRLAIQTLIQEVSEYKAIHHLVSNR